MIKSIVAVVTTGFLGLLSSSAFAEGNDFTTNGKVTKFTKEDGKLAQKILKIIILKRMVISVEYLRMDLM